MWISHRLTHGWFVLVNDLDLHRVGDQDRSGHAPCHHGHIKLDVHVLVLVLQTLGNTVHIDARWLGPHAVCQGQTTRWRLVLTAALSEDCLGDVSSSGTLCLSVRAEPVRHMDATGSGVVCGITEKPWGEGGLQGHALCVSTLENCYFTGQNLENWNINIDRPFKLSRISNIKAH